MYAKTDYDVTMAESGLQFRNAGPLFERYSVELEGPIDERWVASYREIVSESESLARFRLDPAARTVSFTCRATDGPLEVMSVLGRLEELIERVNDEASAVAEGRRILSAQAS